MFSCSDNTDFERTEIPKTHKEIFQNIKTIKKRTDRRNAFNTLTSNEKLFFWQIRLDNFINNNNLSQKQIETIKNVKKMLKPKYFEYGTVQNKGFSVIILKDIINLLEKHFSQTDVYLMLFEIDEKEEVIKRQENLQKTKNIKTKSGNLKECICNVGSRYTCGRINTSVSIQAKASPSVEFSTEFGKCTEGNSCGESSWGCGGFFTQSCNGSSCSNF